MTDINKYREGLACLVPRDMLGGSVITCHEKTLCDCQVLEIFKALDEMRADLINTLEYARETIRNAPYPGSTSYLQALGIVDEALAEWKEKIK